MEKKFGSWIQEKTLPATPLQLHGAVGFGSVLWHPHMENRQPPAVLGDGRGTSEDSTGFRVWFVPKLTTMNVRPRIELEIGSGT